MSARQDGPGEPREPGATRAARRRGAAEREAHAALMARVLTSGRKAPCLGEDGHLWVSDEADDQRRAAELCRGCPALEPCRSYALEAAEPAGVWGGLTVLDRGLDAPEAVRAATDAYQRASDDVRRFIEAECIVNPHMWAAVSDLWARWEGWRADDGAEPMSKKAFGQALGAHGFPADRMRRVRIRWGLGLVPNEEDGPEPRPAVRMRRRAGWG